MDIRLYFPPRPGFPPSTVIVTGVPDGAERSHVETVARKVLDSRALTPYMGRVGWAEIESVGLRFGIVAEGNKPAKSPRKKSASKTRRTPRRKPGS